MIFVFGSDLMTTIYHHRNSNELTAQGETGETIDRTLTWKHHHHMHVFSNWWPPQVSTQQIRFRIRFSSFSSYTHFLFIFCLLCFCIHNVGSSGGQVLKMKRPKKKIRHSEITRLCLFPKANLWLLCLIFYILFLAVVQISRLYPSSNPIVFFF